MNLKALLRPLFLVSAFILAGCGDGPSAPPRPIEVRVTPTLDTIEVTGGTVQFSAQVMGKKNRVLTGIPVTWTSSRPAVAEIGGAGLATAVGEGVTQIRAMAGGVTGEASLTVWMKPARIEKVAGDTQTGIVGKALDGLLQVQVTDGAGTPLVGRSVQFVVLEGGGLVLPGFPVTGADGQASSRWTLGTDAAVPQRVGVSVGDISTEFTAVAQWPPPQVITSFLPSSRLTIEYAAQLEATGGSGASYVWALTAGSLPPGLSLSPEGGLAGTPSEEGTFPLTVEVEDSEGRTASRDLELSVCPAPSQLGPGDVRVLEPTGSGGCGFFVLSGEAGDRYRVGIIRSETNRDPHDVLRVSLEVRGVGVTAEPALLPPSPQPTPWAFEIDPSLQEAEDIARATEAFHLKLREEERRLLASLPQDVRPLPSSSQEGSRVVDAPASGAPERRLLRFPSDGCSDVPPQPALLQGENQHVAVYQDSIQHGSEPVSPAAVQAMLDYYRDYGIRVINRYFGGVSDVNGDGQVVVYVAPGIADGVAGFVRSSDMLGSDYCASSNEMEITYLKASFINGYENGNYQVVGTLVHEIKHISSLYNRLVRREFHPSWVEEGTAEIATDRASRLALAETGGPPMGAMLTLDDIEEFGSTVEGYNTRLRLNRSLRYMASQPNSVTVNPDGAQFMSASGPQERHTIYGAGWHFHRWLGDAYGNAAEPFADTTLFRTQNDSLTTPGPSGYPDLVGRTFQELMEEYAVAVMLNGTEAPLPPRAFTSVDFPSAMASASVYSVANRPFGQYPWSVTTVEDVPTSVSLETASYSGPMGESGLRVHDFTSNGTGQGAEITVYAPEGARFIVVRLR